MKKNFVIIMLLCGMALSASAQDSAIVVNNNKTLVDMYNETQIIKSGDEAKILAAGVVAHYGRALFGMETSSQLTDSNISLKFAIGGYTKKDGEMVFALDKSTHPALAITVENKSDDYIYINLPKSFVKTMDCTMPYYGNIERTGGATKVTSADKGSNFFKKTYNNISQSVKDIGAPSDVQALVKKYTEQVIMVAPHGTLQLTPQMLFEEHIFYAKSFNKLNVTLPGQIPCITVGDSGIKEAERLTWTEQNSPIVITSVITYGKDPKMQNPSSLTAKLYMREMIGESKNTVRFSNSHNLDIYFSADPERLKYTKSEWTEAIKISR